MGNPQPTSDRIICCFDLGPTFVLSEVPSQIEKEGTIRRSEATEERWKFWVEFAEFSAVRALFDYFLNQHFDLDVEWMVKGVHPISKYTTE